MIIPAEKIEDFLGKGRSLYTEMKLRCASLFDPDIQLVPLRGGLSYKACRLGGFDSYGEPSDWDLGVVHCESYNLARQEGYAHVGLVSPLPQEERHALETLEYAALIYIRLAVRPMRVFRISRLEEMDHVGEIEATAAFARNGLGTSLTEGRRFYDVVQFFQDAMFEKLAEFFPPHRPFLTTDNDDTEKASE